MCVCVCVCVLGNESIRRCGFELFRSLLLWVFIFFFKPELPKRPTPPPHSPKDDPSWINRLVLDAINRSKRVKGNGCIRENTSKNENEKNGEGEYGHGEESNHFWMLFLFVCLFVWFGFCSDFEDTVAKNESIQVGLYFVFHASGWRAMERNWRRGPIQSKKKNGRN